ncbi:hypothetical protein M9H77_27351 [Catharanthus roseus]|uniref:Uncharacterized protein n=1 Tax=Catharanthus roseus TaxID=4058 RepID=A0ACC0AC89_CATRO|nr:hypothetical protein M9H77_27351 [Catharanthus roseus]
MTVTLHDIELILGVPAYGNIVDHHYSREQLIAVIQSNLRIIDSNIGINGQDLVLVAKSPDSGLSTKQRAACYVFGNIVLAILATLAFQSDQLLTCSLQ